MTIEATIAAFAAGPITLPEAARAATERLLADTLKVGAAGAASDTARTIAAMAAPGPARLLGGGTAAAPDVAFANGFAIHCLEWDAVHEAAVVHALSVVTATLLAVSDRRGGSDRAALVEAVAVGVEIAAGLGLSATGPMRFFRPATAGVIGAALAAGRLLGLKQDRFVGLLGLAFSFAGGTMQAHAEGNIALPLQIAAAARSAVSAVDLAAAGIAGPLAGLSGPFGYHALIEPIDAGRWLPGLNRRWLVEEVSIKPWPCGRASHGLLTAISEQGWTADGVDALTASVPPLVHRLVGRPPRPDMTSAYARLCGSFIGALMLTDGRIDPRRFTAETFADPALARLASRITLSVDANSDLNALTPQTIANGTDPITLDSIAGSPSRPLTTAQAANRDALLAELAGPRGDALLTDPLAFALEPA